MINGYTNFCSLQAEGKIQAKLNCQIMITGVGDFKCVSQGVNCIAATSVSNLVTPSIIVGAYLHPEDKVNQGMVNSLCTTKTDQNESYKVVRKRCLPNSVVKMMLGLEEKAGKMAVRALKH